MNWTAFFIFIQVFFGVIVGLYFWGLLRSQRTQKVSVTKVSKKELDKLTRLRNISLSQPLAEKIRPTRFSEIIGQMDAITSLKAALCGPHPQHVIVYGPPGVGKTAAARLVLEEAKKEETSPFRLDAPFIEIDGATSRFDERGIADPLMGSVHDPIYQGAGAMGQAGIPQPKEGAVTKAHGGILFIDEIGELHPIQLNKLLKVLEDRKVIIESAYYNEENEQIPAHIHDMFQKGLPADFRLIGATTRNPAELPPALRSRCLEIFFRSLTPKEMKEIMKNAVEKLQLTIDESTLDYLVTFAQNGRHAVSMVQLVGGLVISQKRKKITDDDVRWMVQASRLTPRMKRQMTKKNQVGVVCGLGVTSQHEGVILEIEADATRARAQSKGQMNVTGIVETEQTKAPSKETMRKSMAKSSIENVQTALKRIGVPIQEYDIHVNFPGGIPIDGPSAGIAMAVAVYSAIYKKEVPFDLALTGELSIHGQVLPVGGIVEKVEAAMDAGCKKVILPKGNEHIPSKDGIEIIAVKTLEELLLTVFPAKEHQESIAAQSSASIPSEFF